MTDEQRLQCFMHGAGLSEDAHGIAIGYAYPHFVVKWLKPLLGKAFCRNLEGISSLIVHP